MLYCLERDFLRGYCEQINSIEPKALSGISYENDYTWKSLDDGVALVPIRGVLTDSPSNLGRALGISYTRYSDILQALDEIISTTPGFIKTIILDVNSPGGFVESGLDHTWQAIMGLRESRTVIALNNGVMASGAFWIASAANKIYSTSELNQQGSIGVYSVYIDYSKMDERIGIREVKIRSSNAPKKALDVGDKDFTDDVQKDLDYVENKFIESISKGRGVDTHTIIDTFGQGGLLNTSEALKVGMLDGVVEPNQDFSKTIHTKEISNVNAIRSSYETTGVIETAEDLQKALEKEANPYSINRTNNVVQNTVTLSRGNKDRTYKDDGMILTQADLEMALKAEKR